MSYEVSTLAYEEVEENGGTLTLKEFLPVDFSLALTNKKETILKENIVSIEGSITVSI